MLPQVTLTVRKGRSPLSRASEGPNALWYLSSKDPFPDQAYIYIYIYII